MRQRRGLSPRTQLAVAQLAAQDVDDVLCAMPFLGPILPVPQTHAGLMSHRTPRKQSSKGKLTPRGSFARQNTMSRDAMGGGGNGQHTPRSGSLTGGALHSARDAAGGVTPGKACERVVPAGPPADAFRLTPAEVELATRAWMQILDSSGGQSQDGEGSGGGGGGSSSPSKSAASAVPQQALAFARACTEVAHLYEGRQLQAILTQLHVPVLGVIGELLDQVVELSSGGSSTSAGSTGAMRPSMHFFRFLKFMCECKHLDAILRHRKHVALRRTGGRRLPHSRSDEGGGLDATSLFGGDPNGQMEELEMEDIRATYEYLHNDVALQQAAQQQQSVGGGSPPAAATQQEDASVAGSPRSLANASHGGTVVTAAVVEAFAERFGLSLASVLPPEYLATNVTPAGGRSVSTPPPTSADTLLTGFEPLASSLRAGNASQGSARFNTGGPPPPKPKPTLMATMASAEITLDMFAEHVCGDDPSILLGDDGAIMDPFATPSPGGSPTMSRVASQRGAPGALAPLRLGAVSAPLVNSGDGAGTKGGAGGVTTSVRGGHHSGGTAGMASPTGTINDRNSHSTLLTLQPYATHAEVHSRLSTLMLPPLAYTKFEAHKHDKREKERARREREARLREEYLYGPPRPKPKKKTVEEVSVMLLREATELAESLPNKESGDVHKITSKIRSTQIERQREEEKEANRYAFMLGNHHHSGPSNLTTQQRRQQPVVMSQAVRTTTAQEILLMLQRCPQDSVLGTQTSIRHEQRLRGMNGLDTTASSIARSRQGNTNLSNVTTTHSAAASFRREASMHHTTTTILSGSSTPQT